MKTENKMAWFGSQVFSSSTNVPATAMEILYQKRCRCLTRFGRVFIQIQMTEYPLHTLSAIGLPLRLRVRTDTNNFITNPESLHTKINTNFDQWGTNLAV